ncbi:TOBE domain-containing protein [Undibacterium sp. FT79W]|uniref:TOBE domain-containing protein n=1 Tax=Undibacterium sp. FT79W TaxID=2762296 RepID=UPI00164B5147|nr:TOBE domain-containing protein [Undibacterium sp. FT79W]
MEAFFVLLFLKRELIPRDLSLLLGNVVLLSRLTRRAAALLGIASGQPVWVQVKSVALIE